MPILARYVVSVALSVLVGLAPSACRSAPGQAGETSDVTKRMREACPTLPEEVLDAFVFGVSSLRDDGLSEADAVTQWVQGCTGIPPEGNFQGDIDACRTCLTVIVEDAYDAARE